MDKPALLDAAAIAALRDAEEKIYTLRDVKVMLAQDLAQLYAVETRILLQSVRRNIDRFPFDFAFSATNQDLAGLRSQIVISNGEKAVQVVPARQRWHSQSRAWRCCPARLEVPELWL